MHFELCIREMAVFKCKMCGGTLEINNNESVAICEYCGTKQTLPKLDDEKRVQLYDRANYFRRENEFDKAMGIYEMILSDDKEDCESYWGIVLCRYGIEYVEDPRTHKRIPTVNRAQFTSIFDDEDYKKAIEYADTLQKIVYEEEAAVIDKIQKGILQISSKEEPFDVFICYKETDSSGNRTQDSVYAQDIYTALTKEGYKVFFSRITLEDKLGSAYEPYIFAALNSAKVMLVVGTNKDNFNAVWVKNEWSRYLALIKAGKEKTLIPVYKDISPYEMPEEFQYLQSQDMGKVGYLQDLVRGIHKLVGVKEVKVSIDVQSSTETISVIVDTMLKRADEALAKKEWDKAAKFYDNVLDYDDSNELAFLGKMLVDFKTSSLNELEDFHCSISMNKHYSYLLENGSDEIIDKLNSVNNIIEERLLEKEKLKKEKKKRVKIKITAIISILCICVVLVFGLYMLATKVIIPNYNYNKAVELMNDGQIDAAYREFQALGDYKDSVYLAQNIRFKRTAEQFKDIKVGDYIMFGVYEQDNNSSNGKEDIEWLVLDIKDDKALLISKYALDCKPYNLNFTNVTWQSSTIRSWLNDEFINITFSANEKEMIHNNNFMYQSSEMQDYVFLFSVNEVDNYFDSENARQCEPTEYAIANGAYANRETGFCWWWLRSPGKDMDNAAFVWDNGPVNELGFDVNNVRCAVRPAMWITIE